VRTIFQREGIAGFYRFYCERPVQQAGALLHVLSGVAAARLPAACPTPTPCDPCPPPPGLPSSPAGWDMGFRVWGGFVLVGFDVFQELLGRPYKK
jgi:hypothetical protein